MGTPPAPMSTSMGPSTVDGGQKETQDYPHARNNLRSNSPKRVICDLRFNCIVARAAGHRVPGVRTVRSRACAAQPDRPIRQTRDHSHQWDVSRRRARISDGLPYESGGGRRPARVARGQARSYPRVRRNPATPSHHWAIKSRRINPHGREHHVGRNAHHWIGESRRAHRDLLRQAQVLAGRITAKGRQAIQSALRAIRTSLDRPLAEGLAREAELFGELCETPDKKEGIQAFLEKRAPRFTDR